MAKKKGVVKRAIVTPDKHFPLADMPAINVLCQAIEIVKPDIYIDLGDVGEWNGCSHWQWKKKKRPPLEYQLPFIKQDIEDVNEGMDIIDASLNKAKCKERHMIEGNHDDWMNRFVDEHPYLNNMRFEEWEISEDRETMVLSWSSLCWSSSYTQPPNAFGYECNVRASS